MLSSSIPQESKDPIISEFRTDTLKTIRNDINAGIPLKNGNFLITYGFSESSMDDILTLVPTCFAQVFKRTIDGFENINLAFDNKILATLENTKSLTLPRSLPKERPFLTLTAALINEYKNGSLLFDIYVADNEKHNLIVWVNPDYSEIKVIKKPEQAKAVFLFDENHFVIIGTTFITLWNLDGNLIANQVLPEHPLLYSFYMRFNDLCIWNTKNLICIGERFPSNQGVYSRPNVMAPPSPVLAIDKNQLLNNVLLINYKDRFALDKIYRSLKICGSRGSFNHPVFQDELKGIEHGLPHGDESRCQLFPSGLGLFSHFKDVSIYDFKQTCQRISKITLKNSPTDINLICDDTLLVATSSSLYSSSVDIEVWDLINPKNPLKLADFSLTDPDPKRVEELKKYAIQKADHDARNYYYRPNFPNLSSHFAPTVLETGEILLWKNYINSYNPNWKPPRSKPNIPIHTIEIPFLTKLILQRQQELIKTQPLRSLPTPLVQEELATRISNTTTLIFPLANIVAGYCRFFPTSSAKTIAPEIDNANSIPAPGH